MPVPRQESGPAQVSEISQPILIRIYVFARKVQTLRDKTWVRIKNRFYEIFPDLHPEVLRKIDTSAKCPACGIKKPHVIKWDAITRFVIHSCAQCKADFAESPILPFDKWQKKIVEASE